MVKYFSLDVFLSPVLLGVLLEEKRVQTFVMKYQEYTLKLQKKVTTKM